jgi:hypothetical protein
MLFEKWPEKMPRRGVLVTTFGEQIPFSGFLTHASLLLIVRVTPDTMGARVVMLTYEAIAAVKITDVVETRQFRELGFEGSLPTK